MSTKKPRRRWRIALFGLGALVIVLIVLVAAAPTLVNLGVGLWFLIDLGILKGTPGPNNYGGDPLTALT